MAIASSFKDLRELAEAAAKKAPYDDALALAQRRAALPVAEGGLGLAPGETQAAHANPARGEMRAAPRGGFLGALADLLGGTKGVLNAPGTIPYLNQGVGDLLMGQAPELADSMSYGFSPIRGAGMAATLDHAVVDLVALMAPLAGRAAGAVRNLPGVTRQALLDAYGPAVNMAGRSRWGLGGQEVSKDAMLGEFNLTPPPTPKPKRKWVDKPKPAVVREAIRSTVGARYGMGGVEMTADDLLKQLKMNLPPPPTLEEQKLWLIERQKRLGY